jgi:flagellar motor switch protein FliN/FliY
VNTDVAEDVLLEPVDDEATEVQPASLPELDEPIDAETYDDAPQTVGAAAVAGAVGVPDLRLLADIQLEVSVELGRTRLPMRDLLALGPGSVLQLDRDADAAVDVLVNGTVVARGEVFVVDGDFGVRITEITGR